MTTISVSSTGMPTIIDHAAASPSQNSQEFFFQLPVPGQENATLLLRGRIAAGGAMPAPTQHTFLDSLRHRGFKIPRVLDALLKWAHCAWKILETVSSAIIKCIGGPIKYLGLALLIAGAIHVFIVLLTTPPSAILAGGLIVLVVALVTKGAVPVLLAGGTLYFFGSSLLKNETPAFHSFLNGFPIISYFMTLIPSSYSPTDPHHQG
jgi:uncharacterized membrane protein YraQ (UPF0718 family)